MESNSNKIKCVTICFYSWFGLWRLKVLRWMNSCRVALKRLPPNTKYPEILEQCEPAEREPKEKKSEIIISNVIDSRHICVIYCVVTYIIFRKNQLNWQTSEKRMAWDSYFRMNMEKWLTNRSNCWQKCACNRRENRKFSAFFFSLLFSSCACMCCHLFSCCRCNSQSNNMQTFKSRIFFFTFLYYFVPVFRLNCELTW